MGAARNSRSPNPAAAKMQFHYSHQLLLLVMLAFGILASAEPTPENHDDDDSSKPTPTKAPIFLPHYKAESWSLVRGSILSSNATADETTYTIFCPTETPPACDLSLEFPFVIVGGPHTVKFHGTVTSTYTANVECDLDGTTAATCSGYSSFKSDVPNTYHTGSTEQSWTSTLRDKAVEWGTLTLTDEPSRSSNGLSNTMTDVDPGSTGLDEDDMLYDEPNPTDAGLGFANLVDLRSVVAACLAGVMAVEYIL